MKCRSRIAKLIKMSKLACLGLDGLGAALNVGTPFAKANEIKSPTPWRL